MADPFSREWLKIIKDWKKSQRKGPIKLSASTFLQIAKYAKI